MDNSWMGEAAEPMTLRITLSGRRSGRAWWQGIGIIRRNRNDRRDGTESLIHNS